MIRASTKHPDVCHVFSLASVIARAVVMVAVVWNPGTVVTIVPGTGGVVAGHAVTMASCVVKLGAAPRVAAA